MKIKQQITSFVLLLAILPSLFMVVIIKCHCFGCDNSSVTASIVSLDAENKDNCFIENDGVHCEEACVPCCSKEFSSFIAEYRLIRQDYKLTVVQFNLIVDDLTIPFNDDILINKLYRSSLTDVIKYAPDEPSLAMNCSFLL